LTLTLATSSLETLPRYEERLKYIQTITSSQLHSTFEAFCENVMHPLEMSSSEVVPASLNSVTGGSPQKRGPASNSSSLTNLLRSFALSSSHLFSPTSSATLSPHLLPPHQRQFPTGPEGSFTSDSRRKRANTNEDRMALPSKDVDQCKLMRNAVTWTMLFNPKTISFMQLLNLIPCCEMPRFPTA